MEKKKVSIRLMGHDYTLVTDRSEEQVQQIARYADRKLRELSVVTRSPENVVAVLTCVTLSEELFIAQEENKMLRREIEKLRLSDSTEKNQ